MKQLIIWVLLACAIVGCSQSPNEQQQQADDVPAIKIANDKLFVDDKEMPAKDFVEKYCFPNGVARRGNQTCMAAYTLKQIQNLQTGGAMPKNW